jgi:hypothetical protein
MERPPEHGLREDIRAGLLSTANELDLYRLMRTDRYGLLEACQRDGVDDDDGVQDEDEDRDRQEVTR